MRARLAKRPPALAERSYDPKRKKMMLERLLPGAPSTVWKIIAMEGMERFAYYGFRAILTLFFVRRLGMAESTAVSYFAFTSALAYASPPRRISTGRRRRRTTPARYFSVFYASINVGSSFVVTPVVRSSFGYAAAFSARGAPLARPLPHREATTPSCRPRPTAPCSSLTRALSSAPSDDPDVAALRSSFSVLAMLPVFWMLYDQQEP
ncbi:hypothetical protein JL720_15437 [Aureococcus anophagefferens]|nr:hypothetical protein JL720_15437 [Aureococcus anophagefferens]